MKVTYLRLENGQPADKSLRVVPVEPTTEMIESAKKEDWTEWDQQMPSDHYAALHRAMLAAAPPVRRVRVAGAS